ncbi:DEAD/DEAH box helicase [Niveibacterium terrae]|uniref:DEAD/DEAH box helicase n=1 Tax=Niveibacterium terrae TaxID=3373598 RepID=UPI003A939B9D
MSFASLGLSPALVRAAEALSYTQPTPVQTEAIPAALQGRDLLATAHTGSGKTAAFCLPIVQRLIEAPRYAPRRTQALILVPTRELATQVGETMRGFAERLATPLKVSIVFGGVSINPQMMKMRGGTDVVVATPGRLLDLLDHNALKLGDIATLVLDEADRLLSEGFADELAAILARLPAQRQNQLFSATLPDAVQNLANELLNDPVRIDLAAEPETEPDIVERAIEVDAGRRTALLHHLVEEQAWSRVLVFVATRSACEHVAEKLGKRGILAAPFSSEMTQGARTEALAHFKAGRLQVLVATDLAARGIDIDQLPVVVNYDLPRSVADYVHRIGRTGRAGASGLAVSFIPAASEAHFRLIEKKTNRRVGREQIAGFERQETAEPASADGGIKGRRKSKKDKLREAAARQA